MCCRLDCFSNLLSENSERTVRELCSADIVSSIAETYTAKSIQKRYRLQNYKFFDICQKMHHLKYLKIPRHTMNSAPKLAVKTSIPTTDS